MNPGWYSDGSGLIMEAMQSGDNIVTAAVSLTEANLVVAVGFGTQSKSVVTVVPGTAVTVESDSAPNMILRSLNDPDPRIPKKDVSVKKRFRNDASIVIPANGSATAGYLFFPNDPDAKSIVVVVNLNGTSFRFPFKRSQTAKAKFVLPTQDVLSSESVVATPIHSEGEPVQSFTTTIPTQISSVALASDKLTRDPGRPTGECDKTISFASFDGGQLIQSGPTFSAKWVEKNSKNFPSICFSQAPAKGKQNVLLVFSNSASSYAGFYPTTHTSTSTNYTPTSGNGTLTNSYGSTWNYTYSGTLETTTTTTSRVSVPYTDRTRHLFIYVYDSNGALLSRHSRSITTREGGDGANTFGYNLGAALGAIHLKDGLLKEAVASVSR